MSFLSLSNIVKTFDQTKAVDQVSIEVQPQSIFGMLGPNGAGKTTLIRIITNILLPDSGTVMLEGQPMNLSRTRLIGYMPEERGLYKKMKVGEELLYLARLRGLSKAEAKQKIEAWMERFDILDWWDKKVEELSKGMQQKIQFISTVVHQPKLIILDEPFSGLDPINTNLIRSEIFRLKSEGATIIFSTHRMEQVEEICEEIALIHQGQKVLEGQVHKLKQQFKKNIFKIGFNGNLPNFEQAPFRILEEKQACLQIQTNPDINPNEILSYLIAQGMTIHSFNEVLPSLNEIFITQVSPLSNE